MACKQQPNLSSGGRTAPDLALAKASAQAAAALCTPLCSCQQHPTSPGSSDSMEDTRLSCTAGPVTLKI